MSDSTTIQIQLTKGYTTIIDAIDGDLADVKWHAITLKAGGCVYARRGWKITFHLHRIILERKLGRSLLKTEQVDHIDGNSLNNHRDNLRVATPSQNSMYRGRPSNNTSGYKGVHRDKSTGRWIARIAINRQRISLGSYETPEDAYEAYKIAALHYHGEFARFD